MKKTNKILTRALVILLALVLITSSVVSSTFAKYVVRKEATTKVELQKFGLTVTLEGDGTKRTLKQVGDSIELEYTGITLTPGDSQYKDAIRASINGTASVKADLTITVEITCDDTRYTLSKDIFTPLASTLGTTGKVCNPIAFYVGNSTTPVNTAYEFYDVAADSAKNSIKTNIESKLADAIKTKAIAIDGISVSSTGGTVSGTIDANKQIDLDDIGIGFVWASPAGADSENCLDEIATWISSQGDETSKTTFDVKYTISVVQNTTT